MIFSLRAGKFQLLPPVSLGPRIFQDIAVLRLGLRSEGSTRGYLKKGMDPWLVAFVFNAINAAKVFQSGMTCTATT